MTPNDQIAALSQSRKHVQDYGTQAGYCANGVKYTFASSEAYEAAWELVRANALKVGPFDNCSMFIVVKNDYLTPKGRREGRW
jgi:hypothetical protein